MKPLALGHLNCQILFSFLCMKRKGILCMQRKGILTPKHRQTRGQPSTRIFQPETGLRVGTPLALETLRPQPFWLRTPGKYCEISCNHFLYLMQQKLFWILITLNTSQPTISPPVNSLLMALQTVLLCCKSLNFATLLHYITSPS